MRAAMSAKQHWLSLLDDPTADPYALQVAFEAVQAAEARAATVRLTPQR
jgi:hypothetical protein